MTVRYRSDEAPSVYMKLSPTYHAEGRPEADLMTSSLSSPKSPHAAPRSWFRGSRRGSRQRGDRPLFRDSIDAPDERRSQEEA